MAARSTNSLSRQVLTWIRHLRKVRGLSGAEFVAAVTAAGYPMAPHSLRNWESRQEAALTIDFVAAAAKALDVSIDDLVATVCGNCNGSPPSGFTCTRCGAAS